MNEYNDKEEKKAFNDTLRCSFRYRLGNIITGYCNEQKLVIHMTGDYIYPTIITNNPYQYAQSLYTLIEQKITKKAITNLRTLIMYKLIHIIIDTEIIAQFVYMDHRSIKAILPIKLNIYDKYPILAAPPELDLIPIYNE